MRGAEITLPSSTMANSRPTFSEVTWPNFWPPRRLKRKLTSGSPVRESKLGCASTRSSPATITRFCTGIVPALLLGQRLDFARRIAGIGDQAELQLGGGAEQILHLGRVLKARHFDEHAVDALLLDVGLLGAGAVEAAVQHLDRLGDGVADLFGDRGLGQQQLHRAVAGVGNVERMAGRAGQRAADVLIERPQQLERARALGRVGDAHHDAARLHRRCRR